MVAKSVFYWVALTVVLTVIELDDLMVVLMVESKADAVAELKVSGMASWSVVSKALEQELQRGMKTVVVMAAMRVVDEAEKMVDEMAFSMVVQKVV